MARWQVYVLLTPFGIHAVDSGPLLRMPWRNTDFLSLQTRGIFSLDKYVLRATIPNVDRQGAPLTLAVNV
jgi:hypothetical protein